MTTAVAEPAAPAQADAPVELSEMFYGHSSKPKADVPAEGQDTSAPKAETGIATPPQEIVAPAAEVKTEPPTTEGEDEKAKEEGHRQAARRLGKQVHELKTQMDQLAEENRILKAKVEGTYEEPQEPTPEQIQKRAEFYGLELASREIANQRYGEEAVTERLYGSDSELNKIRAQHPWVDGRISESRQPTIEAWLILEEQSFKSKYGQDPSEWKAKILAEAKPALLEEFKKTVHATPIGAPGPTVTQSRGDGGPSKRDKSLSEMFYGSASSSS